MFVLNCEKSMNDLKAYNISKRFAFFLPQAKTTPNPHVPASDRLYPLLHEEDLQNSVTGQSFGMLFLANISRAHCVIETVCKSFRL